MNRRSFLRHGAQAVAAGAVVSLPVQQAHAAPGSAAAGGSAPILKDYTAADHRRRLQNIAVCTREIRQCMRKHLVTSYLPGQCLYNLGEYPSRKPWSPDEYDEGELDRLKAHGIQLITVMDEWNDRYGLFGGNKLTAVNPDGFRRFVAMVHNRGIKILAYASSGFFSGNDPDYRKEWSRPKDGIFGWWDLPRCSPASPGWRAFFLPRMLRILDEYGVDGLYNDVGYVPNAYKEFGGSATTELAKDEVVAFEETAGYDGAESDLLELIYAELKRRGAIYKVHVGRSNQPQTGGNRVYDYLVVGESVENADRLREEVKNHLPYVVPLIDAFLAKVEGEDEPFLHSIPYMQFPLLLAGRPFTGERAVLPIPRLPGVKCGEARYLAAWKYYQAHPNGPYGYGGWDAIPPSAQRRPTHARWLKQYLPLVEEGTWAWLEIGESALFARPLPKDVKASAFANRGLHLVLANYGRSAVEIGTSADYTPADGLTAAAGRQWSVAPRSLRILARAT